MSSEESSKFSQSSDGSDYEDIAPYFSAKKFDGMPPLQKLSYRNQKIRYEKSLKSGVRISMPKFMQDHLKGKDKENQSSNKGGKKRKSTNTTEKSAKQRKLEDDSSPSQRVLRDRAQLSSVAQPQSNCAAVGETSKNGHSKKFHVEAQWGTLLVNHK
ncbi:uncharacterized protein LOC127749960 [Frankliniella occidentalis]|uniref:Uncharacterized protein LOC127749960 n=1 Tax=Frankliniella occidentalis TaxID=133901 RepID=A0A9C6X060_FRAOC|nr:uncharacterized protein LOC127749960 [Frankliniella occidentalis]